MKTSTFWQLVEQARSIASDDRSFLKKLRLLLSELIADDIVAFDRMRCILSLRLNTNAICAIAYILEQGSLTDDGFMDFRDWIIGRGRKFYDDFRDDPEATAMTIDVGSYLSLPDLFPVILLAYEQVTGSDFPDDHDNLPSPKMQGQMFTEEEMQERFPKLWNKHMGQSP